MYKKDKFKINKITKVGLAEELNFIIGKDNKKIFVNSAEFENKNNKFRVDGYWQGELHADFGEEFFKKINVEEKSIETNERDVVFNFKGKVIDIGDNDIVVDSGFFFNLALRKWQKNNFKVGDFVSVDKPTIWVYHLEPVENDDQQ